MKNSFFSLLTIFFSILIPVSAHAGTSAHGSEFHQDEDNIWFLGDEPVQYCIEVSRIFPVGRPELRKHVAAALNEWKSFFKKYELDKLKFSDLKVGEWGLALNFQEVESCNNPTKQIRFLFGVDDPKVSEVLNFSPKTFGLAVRSDYDHQTYRNGGIVWLRNMPHTPQTLAHLLTHELGHVFGIEHGSVYVMDENVSFDILQYNTKPSLGKIESPFERFIFKPGDVVDYTRHGTLSAPDGTRCAPLFMLTRIQSILDFEPRCHAIQLSFDSYDKTANKAILTLTFTDKDSGQTETMSGRFYMRFYRVTLGKGLRRGPKLFTQRFCSTCSSEGSVSRDALYKADYDLPLEGSFEYKNQVLPATIEHIDNLLFLKVFSPKTKQWWSVEYYVFER